MFRSPWLRNVLSVACSREDRRRPPQCRKRIRLRLESLEERLTPTGAQTVGSYADLVSAVGADTGSNTNYVIQITSNFQFDSGGQVTISKLGTGSTLTIEGQNGNTFNLTGNGNRLFDITSGQNVTFKDLALIGGRVESGSIAQGGGILDTGGNVVLSNVILSGNVVEGGQPAQGGGIYASGGNLTLENGCLIQSNGAFAIGSPRTNLEEQGGGIYLKGGNLTIEGGSTIQSNQVAPVQGTSAAADSQGGGVFVTGPSTVQITDSVISNNSVTGFQGAPASGAASRTAATGGLAAGGGLFVVGNGWTVTLTGDTLSGNTVIGGTGGRGQAINNMTPPGLADGGDGGEALGGGAAFEITSGTSSSTLTILNDPSHPSTILDNSVQGGTGGAGGSTPSTGNNANGGPGGMGGAAIGGGVAITNQGGNVTANIGNTTFYGNQVTGGNGGAGGQPAGTGTTGTAGFAGSGTGGGLAIPVQAGDDNVTMVNSTIAANSVLGGLNGDGSSGGTASGGGVTLAMSSNLNPTFTLDNNTITQNTISSGHGAGLAFELVPSGPFSPPPPATSGNLLLFNNVIQSNLNGTSADDLDSLGSSFHGTSAVTLSNAANNFIGAINANAVSSTSNIIGNTQVQLGNVVGVDSKGNPTGGPIYYPLVSGVQSIGAGSTSVVSAIQSVEGTTTATDEIGNLLSPSGPIDLGAVQFVPISPASPPPSPPSPPPSPSSPPSPPAPPVLHVPSLLALFDSLLGGVETVNANGTETITDSLFGIPLLVSTFDSSGNLESVLLFGVNVTLIFELL